MECLAPIDAVQDWRRSLIQVSLNYHAFNAAVLCLHAFLSVACKLQATRAYFGECDRSFRRIVTGVLKDDFSAVSAT